MSNFTAGPHLSPCSPRYSSPVAGQLLWEWVALTQPLSSPTYTTQPSHPREERTTTARRTHRPRLSHLTIPSVAPFSTASFPVSTTYIPSSTSPHSFNDASSSGQERRKRHMTRVLLRCTTASSHSVRLSDSGMMSLLMVSRTFSGAASSLTKPVGAATSWEWLLTSTWCSAISLW